MAPSAQPAAQPAAPPPLLYRELSKKQRMMRGAITAFTIYHAVAMLIGGTVDKVKRVFAPVFEGYDQGLRMTNSWGMFGKPPLTDHVTIEAEKRDGTRILLSTTRAVDRTTFERVRDVRIRKIQSKLTDPIDRNRFGTAYLDYFCRLARVEHGQDVIRVDAVQLAHERQDLTGKVIRKESSVVVMSKACDAGPKSGVTSPLRPPTLLGPQPAEGAGEL